MKLIDQLKIFIKNKKTLISLDADRELYIHFGCGNNKFPQWLNTDLYYRDENLTMEPDMYIDITETLPFKSGSSRYLYSEHLIEHVGTEKIEIFFREAHRILKKGGVLRIATPDLKYLVKKYLSKNWRKQDWLTWPEYKFIQTPSEMLNIVFRWWGHKYLYDEKELHRRLANAGFRQIRRVYWGKSKHEKLCGLENRKDSKLIMEATK